MAGCFRGRGYWRLLAAVLPEDRSSLRSWGRVGYRRVGLIGFVGLGPWRRAFCFKSPFSVSAQLGVYPTASHSADTGCCHRADPTGSPGTGQIGASDTKTGAVQRGGRRAQRSRPSPPAPLPVGALEPAAGARAPAGTSRSAHVPSAFQSIRLTRFSSNRTEGSSPGAIHAGVEKRLKQGPTLVLGPRPRADRAAQHQPVSTDEVCHRRAPDPIGVGCLSIRIQKHLRAIPATRDHPCDSLAWLRDIHEQNLEPLRPQFVMQHIDRGQLPRAVRSPGRPEVDQDDLAAKLA